ncbi:AbrB/MazE/SpoVT family DNA-binding domain-containing protein [Paraburkholderia phymatum]|uniref:Transcriptional regulator, AbrB family n=1 Tax=Paraburkholderia phymatum (strain DSM 17167 / CIP 108236 / LMG 21445 / STM815) TaxID=391038 RepID=B2JT84_PARP8|nr:AbrB/MazE/SpoVT family DNA-binding domain-containing protein [Paraburkholderia phymatum]ACC75787.1 transcriptional regulator, AbrB family [Paraburkholderia phymatum STM815]
MNTSTIDAYGRTTLPAAVRSAVGVKPGTKLHWHLMPDGSVLVRIKTKSILELAGSLPAPDKPVCIEDMNPWS